MSKLDSGSRLTLSFDNGPTPEVTPYVLDELEKRDLTAYFCLVGTQLAAGQEQRDIAHETFARGHILVNHSSTHRVPLGEDPAAEHAQKEIVDMHTLLHDSLGDWGAPWFRPFGRGGLLGSHVFSKAAVRELQARDYSVLLWNSVPRDWENVDGWVATALADMQKQTHTVVVLHDLNTGAMQHLGRFLDVALAQGVEFTVEVPEDCRPLVGGEVVWSEEALDALVCGKNVGAEN